MPRRTPIPGADSVGAGHARPLRRRARVPAEGLGEALVELDPRPPAELRRDQGRIERAASELTGTQRLELRLERGAGCPLEALEEREDGRLAAPADVEDPRRSRLGGEDERARDVGRVHVVAGLAAVAEHRRPLAREQAPTEDGDDARLPVRVLARAVD